MASSYLLESRSTRGNFVLIDPSGRSIGDLHYPKWYISNAELALEDRYFSLKKKSIWKNCARLWEGEEQRGEVTFDWRGRVRITLGHGEEMVLFHLRRRGFLNPHFEVLDAAERRLATLRQRFRWRTFQYDIEVVWESEQGNAFSRGLLLMLVGHALTTLRKQQSAAAG
jgi:hypothetical protein